MKTGEVTTESKSGYPEETEATQSTASLIREIEKYSGKLLWTMVYFIFLSIFLVIIVVWAFYGFSPVNVYIFVPLYAYAFFIVVFFPMALWNGIRLIRPLKRWLDSASDVMFQMTFELLPPIGDTPHERILNKVSELYTDIPRLRKERPDAVRRDVGVGKGRSVAWDFVIDLSYPRFDGLLSRLHSPEYLLVKRIEAMKPVETPEIRHLVQRTMNDLKRSPGDIIGMFIVSTNGFSNETIDYVEDVLDEVDFNIALIFEYRDSYYLAEKVEPPELYPS